MTLHDTCYMMTAGAAGYGSRIYIPTWVETDTQEGWQEDRRGAIRRICIRMSQLCKWGGHDKTITNEEGQYWVGYEFDQVHLKVAQDFLWGQGWICLSRDKTIEVFREFSVR